MSCRSNEFYNVHLIPLLVNGKNLKFFSQEKPYLPHTPHSQSPLAAAQPLSAPATMRSRPPLTPRRPPPGIDQYDQDSGRKKTKHRGKNVVWSPAMDRYLIEALAIQARNGNKVDKCFNENAYNAACVAVNTHFNLSLNNQKVINRLKTIKKRYNIISNILSEDGFSWNPNTNTIDCEDDDLWKRYIAAHPDARAFRGKQIPLYEEMKIVCGNYQAPGRWTRMLGKVNGNPVVECKYEQESASYLSASSEHMSDSDGTETQSSAKEPVYTEMPGNNEYEDEDVPEAQPERQAVKRTHSSETLQDAMLAIASSIRHLADTIELSKYTIDAPALLQAVMEVEGLEESSQMYAFEFLNEDPVKARAFMAYNRRMRKIYLFRLFGGSR